MPESSNAPMIEAAGLSKFYGDFAAIRDVTFSIPQGQVAAFLGPNGAGKSTTMKILTGYLAPSSGAAHIAGLDVATDRIAAAERLGYLPENGPLYTDMTPLGLLKFFGRARGLTGAYLQQRIDAGIAQVLLHEPDVLIMDEPTSGLDPNQTREVRQTIRELGRNKTILLSTHILQEVEAMAGRVIFINRGRVVFDGTPAEMQAGYASLDDAFRALTEGPMQERPSAGRPLQEV